MTTPSPPESWASEGSAGEFPCSRVLRSHRHHLSPYQTRIGVAASDADIRVHAGRHQRRNGVDELIAENITAVAPGSRGERVDTPLRVCPADAPDDPELVARRSEHGWRSGAHLLRINDDDLQADLFEPYLEPL